MKPLVHLALLVVLLGGPGCNVIPITVPDPKQSGADAGMFYDGATGGGDMDRAGDDHTSSVPDGNPYNQPDADAGPAPLDAATDGLAPDGLQDGLTGEGPLKDGLVGGEAGPGLDGPWPTGDR